jgi:hypothetical protein
MLPALKGQQLQTVIAAAEKLPPEKRTVFLQRVAGRLQLRGFHFTDDDLDAAVRLALQGLIQNSAA